MSMPSVSVVMPVRDGVRYIGRAVASALAQDYPGPFEVIVADGGSSDGTLELLQRLRGDDRRLRIVDNPRGRTPAGLNAAIAAASGSVIVRCDAAAILPAGYIRRAIEILDATGADVVGGGQVASGEGTRQRAIAIAMTTWLGTGGAVFRSGGVAGPTDTVYLGVFRRSALERVGLYDETLVRNQDYELNWRIRDTGGVVYFDPELSVGYSPRSTLRGLWSQYWQYGEWKRKVLRRHPESVRARQLAPPLFVIALGASAVLAFTPWRAAALIVPATYLAVILVATAVELVRRRDTAVLLMPAALATMHLSWGLGFVSTAGTMEAPEVPSLGES